VVLAAEETLAVIPGRAESTNPEFTITSWGHGFRLSRCALGRNDDGETFIDLLKQADRAAPKGRV
jgi:hypothetical protein